MMRVEDFAVGVVGLIGNPMAYNEAFNICGDETPSFNEVLECLSELIGASPKLVDVDSFFTPKNYLKNLVKYWEDVPLML